MDSSPVPIPAPVPAPTPAPSDEDKLPQHTKPSRIKVLELPEKQRKRAESTADRLAVSLEDSRIRAALLNISKGRDESHIRTTAGDRTGWAVLQVEKRGQRETMPTEARANKLSGPPPRLVVSAPVVPKGGLLRPLPASPVGNAWSGEHYWKPQFSESLPGSPTQEEDESAQSDPARQAVYDSVVADVETYVRELKAENAQSGEEMTDAECDVVAAMMVLEEKNTLYASENELPVPKDVFSKVEDLGERQKGALKSNTIRNSSDIRDPGRWLQLEPSSLQYTTTLDYVHAGLRMVKEHRKSAELEPPGPASRLVYAVQVLEEKIRKLKARDSYEESSDDEMVEYGKFLKSIAELTVEGGQRSSFRRDVSESSIERRRLRGKAPSTLDLEAWASELKTLDGSKGADKTVETDFL